jgi:hypothetical protein
MVGVYFGVLKGALDACCPVNLTSLSYCGRGGGDDSVHPGSRRWPDRCPRRVGGRDSARRHPVRPPRLSHRCRLRSELHHDHRQHRDRGRRRFVNRDRHGMFGRRRSGTAFWLHDDGDLFKPARDLSGPMQWHRHWRWKQRDLQRVGRQYHSNWKGDDGRDGQSMYWLRHRRWYPADGRVCTRF